MSPSTNQGGAGRDRVRLKDPLADAAARWLDRDIAMASRQSQQDRKLQLAALIRGIDTIERVRAWIAAEYRIASEHGRKPRSWVIDRLEAREATLEDIGERPDRLEHGPREDCECCPPFDEWQAEKRQLVERAQANSGREAVQAASADDVVADAFATDGGEPSDGD